MKLFMKDDYGQRTPWHDPKPTPKMKLFIIVSHGCVTDVYADSNKVEVEIIGLDEQDEDMLKLAQRRADEVQAEYVRVD